MLDAELKKNARLARPNLETFTRKQLLCPTARKMYHRILQIKKAKRKQAKLKRCKTLAKQNKSQTIKLCDDKRNNNAIMHVRQNFIDMLIRNHNIAPQVHFS